MHPAVRKLYLYIIKNGYSATNEDGSDIKININKSENRIMWGSKQLSIEFDKDNKYKLYSYYEDGKIKLIADHKDDLRHGQVIAFYPNNDIKYKGEFKSGLKDGKWEYYDKGIDKPKEIRIFSKGIWI